MNTLRVCRLSRRALLRAAGITALAPFVPTLEARAGKRPLPKRLIFFFSSNGTVRERWLPIQGPGELVLSDILKPLEAHKSKLLVIDGIGYNCTHGARDGHEGAMPAALTGSVPQTIDTAKKRSRASGISVDQLVANAFARETRFPSLECGVQVDTYDAEVYALSYAAPLYPIAPENDPYHLWARVFGALPLGGARPGRAALDRLRARRSVLDLVRADLRSLTPMLARDEQRKMAAHLQAVREIERTLTTGPGPARNLACTAPAQHLPIDVRENDNIPLVAKLHTDILIAAMACDLVRVGTIQHGRGGANHRLSWLGEELGSNRAIKGDGTVGIHGLAHNEADPTARELLVQCHRWYASQVADFVSRLSAIPEGNGTMADRTLVVWMNELGTGNHSHKNVPWVLVGNAGGYFQTGRMLQFPGRAHNDLLLSIAHASGLEDVASFGARNHCTGPLPGLTSG